MTLRSRPNSSSAPQRPDRAAGQPGQDRKGVDEALVENAEHDVDRDDGGGEQQALVARAHPRRRAPCREGRADRRRHVEFAPSWHRYAPPPRPSDTPAGVSKEIVIAGSWPELVDRERAGGPLDAGKGRERHEVAVGTADAHEIEPIGRPVHGRIELDQDLVAVAGRVDGRDLPRRRSPCRGSSATGPSPSQRSALSRSTLTVACSAVFWRIGGHAGEDRPVSPHRIGEADRPGFEFGRDRGPARRTGTGSSTAVRRCASSAPGVMKLWMPALGELRRRSART